MIGRIVGTYKILETLGEGGVGMVYKGIDTMLDREVAIKVMRPELASQTSVVERFRSEAITLAKLNHPNIATLFSLFRDAEDLFMVLEFVKGETLEDILQRQGKMSVEEALPIFCQALEGINYAHELGIVHRDIKPSNMMLNASGKLKVLDFGIASLLGSARMTRVGNIIGTLEYMSPEQVRGEETDARSDIYGLGMMLYEVLTGRLPFESENEFVLMKAHTKEMPVPPRELNPDIPVEIESAIMKAVAKDPGDRFQNGGEFLETIFAMNLSSVSKSIGTRSIYQAKPRPAKKVQSKDFQIDLSETAEVGIKTPKTEKTEEANIAVSQDVAPSTGEIKETRLGDAEDVQASPRVIKETRLGASKTPITDSSLVKETRLQGKSQKADVPTLYAHAANTSGIQMFLSKLSWVHYTGAGVIAIAFLGVVGLAAIIPFLYGGGNAPSNTKVVTDKNSNTEKPKPAVTPEDKNTPSEVIVSDKETPISTPIDEIDEENPQLVGTKTPRSQPTQRKTPGTQPTRRKTPRTQPTRRKTPRPTPRRNRRLDCEMHGGRWSGGRCLKKTPRPNKTPDPFDN